MKKIFVLGMLVLTGLVLAQPKVFKGTEIGKPGGSLRISSISDPRTFNPFVARETSSTDIINNFFPYLTGYNPYTLQPEGFLATSWEVRNNGLTVIFKLRQGAKWSDGQTIDADDVIFSATVHADPKVNSNSRSSFVLDGQPIKWSKVDQYTVRADFPKPYAPALIQSWLIAPEHIFGPAYRQGPEKLQALYNLDTPPAQIVVGGPFTLDQYAKGERVVLKRNPSYWGTDEKSNPVAYLERWTFQIVSNTEAQLARFLGGDADLYAAPDGDKVAQVLERIRSGRLNAQIFPNADVTTGTNFIVFNWNNKDPFKANLFRQVKFRRAMAHLMDKKSMIEVAQGGLGRPQWSPISIPVKQFFTDDVAKYEFSPQKATQLLAELGFRTKNKDGFLVNAQGQVLEFNLATNQGNTLRERIAQIFADEARKVGVKVNYRPIDFNELVRQLTSPAADGTREFDAILIGLTGGIEPAFSRNVWQLNGSLHMWNLGMNGQNPTRLEPFEVLIDKLMTQGATTLDPAKRREIYVQFQKVVAENLPVIYTVAPAYNPARLNRIGGLFGKEEINAIVGQYPYIETVFAKE
ncbi:extracellular solute-binding protein family 5 [Allomeiothermus silvanus DSM 9946]|uniref:Extracellular solute-binding protein family 5 n=1 Tax=Allomeiothermus silvanus (strain ATCC 700542 / DSM 9946 / NBRC 106475 / NCIMB 13440 / VI-R2) TaxID=526227 RepID=D7BEL7_ALLS1|nr:ABC transporter substrate-binding protein [Allomeiothermus silvanus]ADH63260.1 extracellular solute-binding protein family 5 [Allomeiothermus silvanus DSM 9946]